MELSKKYAEVTAEQIKANIYKIYYQLVVGKTQLSSLEANIDRFTKLLHDTKEIYKNGFAEKLDVDKLVVQLNNLTTEKEKVINQLYVGNAGLKFLLNMPQKEELILTDSLTEGELKSNIMDESVNYSDRKEIQLLTLASKMNGYNVKRYNLSRIPTVAAFGSYSKNAQRTSFNFFDKGDWFTTSLIGLKVAVPIFDGFGKKYRYHQKKLNLEKLNNGIKQQENAIDLELSQANINLANAQTNLEIQKRNLDLAQEVVRVSKVKYRQGVGSNLEVTNAESSLKESQNNYYTALYDFIIAKVDLDKAQGQLVVE
jgi:outer membrane protein TolC